MTTWSEVGGRVITWILGGTFSTSCRNHNCMFAYLNTTLSRPPGSSLPFSVLIVNTIWVSLGNLTHSSVSKYHIHAGYGQVSICFFNIPSEQLTHTIYLHVRLLHLLAYHVQDQTYLLFLQCCFSSCVSFLSERDHHPCGHPSRVPGSHL